MAALRIVDVACLVVGFARFPPACAAVCSAWAEATERLAAARGVSRVGLYVSIGALAPRPGAFCVPTAAVYALPDFSLGTVGGWPFGMPVSWGDVGAALGAGAASARAALVSAAGLRVRDVNDAHPRAPFSMVPAAAVQSRDGYFSVWRSVGPCTVRAKIAHEHSRFISVVATHTATGAPVHGDGWEQGEHALVPDPGRYAGQPWVPQSVVSFGPCCVALMVAAGAGDPAFPAWVVWWSDALQRLLVRQARARFPLDPMAAWDVPPPFPDGWDGEVELVRQCSRLDQRWAARTTGASRPTRRVATSSAAATTNAQGDPPFPCPQ